MNKAIKHILMMSGGKRKYGTAGTTTQTTLASQGGLLINIDSATGNIAQTSSGWIEDEKYGFYARETTTSTSAEFDTAVIRTGAKSLKLQTLDATGVIRCFPALLSDYSTAATNIASSTKFIPCKGSTKYRWSFWVKTTNVPASGFTSSLTELNSAGTAGVVNSQSSVTGTVDWQRLTTVFTTAASAINLGFTFSIIAGNIADAYIDVNSMTLEEVIEPVANSLVTPSPSIVSFTAVGSTDNIDQSFTTTPNGSVAVGDVAGLDYIDSQSFTATKSKLTGVYLYKRANSGTPTGNLKIDIRTNNAGDPSGTILATSTISLATYNALSTNAEFLVNLPCNLTAGSVYHIVASNTANEGVGIGFNLGRLIAGGYTGGDARFSSDGGTTWTINGTSDMYFKTLYYKPTTNFKASQNNLNVSISADDDGFLNGSVINLVNGTATFTETFGTFYLLQYTVSGSDLIAEINLPGVGLSGSFTSDRTLEYSSDGVTYGSTFPTGFTKVWVKILAYSGFASFSYSIGFSTAGINVLKNYPTNKDIIKQYATTLSGATTSATYRATKWGFPAIEYSATEYQFLDVDTTATGSTVAFSELGTTYTTVADGASLAISSTSTPNIFVKANITANRLYLSSNCFNATSDKDGSMRETVVYSVIQ